MTVNAEDLGYPPADVIMERLADYERRQVEAAARRARGEGPPGRRLSEVHRERVRQGVRDWYFKLVLDDPAAPPLRRARAVRGLTADDLSTLANVGKRTLFRAESDPHEVGPRSWERLAAALDVKVSEIKPRR